MALLCQLAEWRCWSIACRLPYYAYALGSLAVCLRGFWSGPLLAVLIALSGFWPSIETAEPPQMETMITDFGCCRIFNTG